MIPTQPPKPTRGGWRRGQRDTAPEGDLSPTRKRRRVNRITDSGRMPALRLNGYVGREPTEQKSTVVYDTEHAPGYLRLARLGLGLGLLAVAWVASLLVVALGQSLWDVFPHQPSLTIRFGLYVLGALGIIWLAVVSLVLITVGAFSFSLALTRRGW
jgi:hypothetical protein